jgi:hypothetical protein
MEVLKALYIKYFNAADKVPLFLFGFKPAYLYKVLLNNSQLNIVIIQS